MLLIITFTLFSLVAINFILLAFSCNKTSKSSKKPNQTKRVINVRSTKPETENHLAPTGS